MAFLFGWINVACCGPKPNPQGQAELEGSPRPGQGDVTFSMPSTASSEKPVGHVTFTMPRDPLAATHQAATKNETAGDSLARSSVQSTIWEMDRSSIWEPMEENDETDESSSRKSNFFSVLRDSVCCAPPHRQVHTHVESLPIEWKNIHGSDGRRVGDVVDRIDFRAPCPNITFNLPPDTVKAKMPAVKPDRSAGAGVLADASVESDGDSTNCSSSFEKIQEEIQSAQAKNGETSPRKDADAQHPLANLGYNCRAKTNSARPRRRRGKPPEFCG